MPLANRTRAGRRDCGGGAPFCAALRAALCAMRSRKRPCQPKTAKRIFGGPGSQGPSGQAKEQTRILPVRRGSFCPACRAIWQAGRSCAASRCCGGFCARCSGVCSLLQPWRPCVRLAAIVSAFCGVVFRPTRRLPLLRPACAAPGVCLSFVRCAQRAQVFCCFFSRAAHGKLFLFCRCFAALFPACISCRLLLFRGLLRPLPVCLFCVVYASSLLFFCPFLPNFFLSNFFSFVAQAATGLYFLPKRK